MKDSYIVIFITAANPEEARQISDTLLENKKAACVNVISEIDSHFWWNNQIDSERETLLIVKSKASLLPEIIELVKGAHSYEVPEIIAMPVIGGNPDYLEWIDKSVS